MSLPLPESGFSMQAIHAAGGRKFVLMNFGQFGCTPAAILRNRGVCR